jgi:RHS repeat-associated protein
LHSPPGRELLPGVFLFSRKDAKHFKTSLVLFFSASLRLCASNLFVVFLPRMEWNEWGNCLLDTNPGFQPFGFAGSLYDADLNLHHQGAREYDPTVGRWLQPDPLGLEGGLNLYAYCANDPVNYIDPTGLDPYSALERAAINGYNRGGFWGGLQANLASLGTAGLDCIGGRGVAMSAAASGEAYGKDKIGAAIGYGGLTIAQMGLNAWGEADLPEN